jgi:hypothetical protein
LPLKVKDALLANNINTLADLERAMNDISSIMAFKGVGAKTITLLENTLEYYGIRKYRRPKKS